MRSTCFAIVGGFLIISAVGPLMSLHWGPDVFYYPEYIGAVAGFLLFGVLMLVPLPNDKHHLLLAGRSLLAALFVSFLFFVLAKQYDPPLHALGITSIIFPCLFVGLLLWE